MTRFTQRQQTGLVIILGFVLGAGALGPAQFPWSEKPRTNASITEPGRTDDQARLFLLGHRLDLNRATPQELTLLPRIGAKRAAAIVRARSGRGGFRSLEDLAEIPGFGPSMINRLRPLVRCGP
jgi:competence ComEA-like helix-hairpin-helix protein